MSCAPTFDIKAVSNKQQAMTHRPSADFDFLYHMAGQTTHQLGGSLDVSSTLRLTCCVRFYVM